MLPLALSMLLTSTTPVASTPVATPNDATYVWARVRFDQLEEIDSTLWRKYAQAFFPGDGACDFRFTPEQWDALSRVTRIPRGILVKHGDAPWQRTHSRIPTCTRSGTAQPPATVYPC